MPSKEEKAKYDMEYAKKNLKRIPLDVQKEKYEEIKQAAAAAEETINGYIKKAIDERMERENKRPISAHTEYVPEQHNHPNQLGPESFTSQISNPDSRDFDQRTTGPR